MVLNLPRVYYRLPPLLFAAGTDPGEMAGMSDELVSFRWPLPHYPLPIGGSQASGFGGM